MEALSLFVLKKALGRFIRFDESQKRSLDSNAQFGVSLSNVALDAESCNAALSQAGVPVAIKEANIRELSVRLKSPELVAKGVVVELALAGESAAARSKQAQPLSSSVHFAREYLSQAVSDSEDESDTDTGYSNESTSLNGATALARAIDSVLNSAAFSIHDVTLKLHISHFVIHMHIALLDYKNSDLNHSHSKESRSGISGVLARISNKQATFKGVSLRICQLDDTNPSGPPIFESRLFVMSDAEVENLIKLNVKQDLGLEPEVGLAGSSISGPTPVWDIDISFETMVYSMLDLQTLDCIKQVLASINSEGMGVRSRPSDDATTASFASDNSNSEKRKSQSFRIEIRLPIYMGFLLYSNTPLSPESIQLLIDQNEKKIAAESIHHLKLEMNGIRILFAHDSQGRQKLSFDTLRTDVSEFTTGTPHELDLPINKYNSLLSFSGKSVSKLFERTKLLYKPLEELSAAVPESMFFRFVSRNSAAPGLFGDRQGEGGVFGMSCLLDLSGQKIDLKIGEITVLGDLRTWNRVLDVLKRVLSISDVVEDSDEMDGSDSDELSAKSGVPFTMEVSIDLIRTWLLIPATKLLVVSPNALNANMVVFDILDIHATVDPSAKTYKVGSNVIQTQINTKFSGIGISLAVPVTKWREYKLTPLAYLSGSTVAVQQMSPHLISLAETVYFDGNEGYSEEEDIDEDEQEFGYKSWFNIGGESMENIRAKLANRNVKESAILKARNGALSSSKLALIIHLARMQLSLGKYEFDCVQLLLNDIQLYQDLLNPNVEGSNSENEDSDAFEFDLSHVPFIFSVVLRVDEIVCGLYKVNGENGALDWAYHIQMNESHIVAAVREGGNIDAHIEMDRITFLNIDKQPIFLRSENLSERRPMMAIAFNSIFDKTIGMKENSVSISLSELRFFVVDQILLDLVTDINSFLVEPPGLEPVPVIDAVTKLTLVLNGIVVDYRPMYRQFRAVLLLRRVKVILNLIPHSPTFGITIAINDIGLHLLKSSSYIGFDIDEQTLMIEKGVQTYLEKCRYANVFACDLLGISYRQTRGLNQVLKTEVELSNGNAYLDFCLDSHRLLMDILEYIGAGGDGQYLGTISEKLPSIQREKNILVDVPDMDRILETIDDKAFAKFIPSTKSSEREYNENELDVSDVLFGGAIAISDPRSHIQKEEILVYDEGPFEFYGDYLSLTGTPGLMDDMIVPEKTPPALHLKIKDLSLIVRMFDGFDFPIQDFPDDDSDSFSGHPLEKSMMEDDDFETQPKDSPSNGTPTLEFRSSEPRIQINLTRVNVESKIFPETNVCASELLLSIDVLEVIDNVTTSMWRKFLTAMRPGEDDRPLETGSSMLIIDWVKVRPKLEVPESQEIRLKVHVSPLRFYVDQDALAFIGNFLSYGAKPVQETDSVSQETAPSVDNEPKSELFFQMCSIRPIPVKIDYKPKHVDFKSLRGGNLLEVFNFVPLEGAEMTLNQVRLNGVQGVEKLISLIRNQWLQEVTKNQPHRVVKGLSGIKPIANIGAGIADLILLPWKQYQREGKVLRGFEKGAKSFSKTAAMETLALGTRLAITTQAILEGVERNAGSTSVGRSSNTEKNKSKLSEQPRNIREGIEQGAQSLARNVNDAVKTVLDAPGKGRQNEGSSAGAVARAVPVAILRPVIGATEAVSKTLLGLQNTIDPTKKKQMEDKYKG